MGYGGSVVGQQGRARAATLAAHAPMRPALCTPSRNQAANDLMQRELDHMSEMAARQEQQLK